MEINKIYNEDCVNTIKRMPDNFLDLVITSPPYNVDLGNNKNNKNRYDLHNDNMNYLDYLNWLNYIFWLLYPKMKLGGRVCINRGGGANEKGFVLQDTINFMRYIGYLKKAHIIWNKTHTSGDCSWGSWMSPSCPSFRSGMEHILVFSKGSYKLQEKGQSDLTKDEFLKYTNSIWQFLPELKAKQLGHPAPFPIELPFRCIKMLSWVGALVYDPFSGSGTVALACKKLNRRYIGSEISSKYCRISYNRLASLLF